MKINVPISKQVTRVALSVPRSNPPLASGLVKKSPKVAPKGRVNMKANQNNTM